MGKNVNRHKMILVVQVEQVVYTVAQQYRKHNSYVQQQQHTAIPAAAAAAADLLLFVNANVHIHVVFVLDIYVMVKKIT